MILHSPWKWFFWKMFVLVQWNTSVHFCYRAVDGNREDVFLKGNTCTHTKDNKNAPSPFWVVDLGDIYRIQSVRIWNRNDCCSMYILFVIHTVSWLIWLLFYTCVLEFMLNVKKIKLLLQAKDFMISKSRFPETTIPQGQTQTILTHGTHAITRKVDPIMLQNLVTMILELDFPLNSVLLFCESAKKYPHQIHCLLYPWKSSLPHQLPDY